MAGKDADENEAMHFDADYTRALKYIIPSNVCKRELPTLNLPLSKFLSKTKQHTATRAVWANQAMSAGISFASAWSMQSNINASPEDIVAYIYVSERYKLYICFLIFRNKHYSQ